ncbi:MAG: hypothetical protein J0L62_11140 [Bacteroidetes bacterium]|nr:hypothetical protein [Bacteroidota bacterium]
MEPWSDLLPVRERFRIKFYLDTNILVYLVDNTYSGVLQTINYLKDSNFSDLVSSKYVIFEFVGIRKKEHYLRAVVSSGGLHVNMSSLLKYRDDFNASEVDFNSVKTAIKQKVMQELEEITNNFGIEYERNILHDSLLAPTFDITLSTKISRHDALMYVSSVWGDAELKEEYVFVISNDQGFVQNCSDEEIDIALQNHNLQKPQVEWIRSMQENDVHRLNLTVPEDDVHLTSFLPSKLKELIIKKNNKFFLGKTIQCGNGARFPTDVVCFRLPANTELQSNLYLTIIGRDLDFIYSTKLPVSDFWDQIPINNYPFHKPDATDISFRPMEDNYGTPSPLPTNVISRLRESGNLVFINPDGNV